MGKILIDIPQLPDGFIEAENIEQAIHKLREYEVDAGKESLNILKRFKGILKQKTKISEQDWYKQ